MMRLLVRALAVFAGAVLIHRLVWLPNRCNQTLRAVEATTRSVLLGSQQAAAPVVRDNIQRLESVAVGCPHDFDRYLLLGINKRLIGRLDEAIDDLTRSLQTADRPEIYFDRGLLYLESGKFDAALCDFSIVGEFVPLYLEQLDVELRRMTEQVIRERRSRLGATRTAPPLSPPARCS